MKIQAHSPKIETRNANHSYQKRAGPSRIFAMAMILALALTAWAGTAFAQGSPGDPFCSEKGKNVQCTEFGYISMDAMRDVTGEPITVTADIHLNTGYAHQGARWVMFSIRNVTNDGQSPVTIGIKEFSTAEGDIVLTRAEHVKPSEVNLWVDVLDLPIGKAITLELNVGVTQRGAFSLETLVLAFDRGYEPIKNQNGNDASLFSSTLLGVNKETQSTAGGNDDSDNNGGKLPSVGVVAVLAVLSFACAMALRRQRR